MEAEKLEQLNKEIEKLNAKIKLDTEFLTIDYDNDFTPNMVFSDLTKLSLKLKSFIEENKVDLDIALYIGNVINAINLWKIHYVALNNKKQFLSNSNWLSTIYEQDRFSKLVDFKLKFSDVLRLYNKITKHSSYIKYLLHLDITNLPQFENMYFDWRKNITTISFNFGEDVSYDIILENYNVEDVNDFYVVNYNIKSKPNFIINFVEHYKNYKIFDANLSDCIKNNIFAINDMLKLCSYTQFKKENNLL